MSAVDNNTGCTHARCAYCLCVPLVCAWLTWIIVPLSVRGATMAEGATRAGGKAASAVESMNETDRTMSRPLLYKTDASPPSCAVRMLADIIGLELNFKEMNFVDLDHKAPDFVKINPMGTVPTLQDGDFVISESHTIMKYLLSKYGGAKSEALYPSELRARALVDQCMFFNVGVYFIRLKVVALPTFFSGLEGPTPKDREDIDTCYGIVEAYLGKNKYIAADHLTLADLSAGATTAAMQPIHKLDPKKFPLTSAWLSRLLEEPYFKKIVVPGVKLFDQALNAYWAKNKKQ